MKRIYLLFFSLIQVFSSVAQIEQHGYTRTVQHLKQSAKYIDDVEIEVANSPLKSISKNGGRYSILATSINGVNGYTLKSVKKKGYRLVDDNILHKFQRVGTSDVDILIISEEEERMLYKSIYKTLKDSLEKDYKNELNRCKGKIATLDSVRVQYETKIKSLSKIVPMLVCMDYKDASDMEKEFAIALENGNVQQIIELSEKMPDADMLKKGYKNYKDEYLAICDLQFHAKMLTGDFDEAAEFLLAKICADSTNVDYWLDAGDFYVKYLEDDKKAQQIYQKALAFSKLHGDSSYLVAKCYLSIFKAYSFSGKPLEYNNALSMINDAIDIVSRSKKSDMMADALIRRSIINMAIGDRDGASSSFELAMIFLSFVPEAYSLRAELYQCMAKNMYEQKKYREALNFSLQSLLYIDSMPITNNELLYNAYNSIGSCYSNLNLKYSYFDSSIYYMKKQLDLCLDVYGEHHTKSAHAYFQLASSMSNHSVYSRVYKKEARTYFDKALNIYRKIEGGSSDKIAMIWHNMAGLYRNTEEYDSAATCLLKEINVKKEMYGDTNIMIAKLYEDLGDVVSLTDKQKSFEYYKKALDIKKILYDDDKQGLIESYVFMGEKYRFKGVLAALKDSALSVCYYRQAICFYDTALNKYKERPFKKDSVYAELLMSRGKIYNMIKHREQAINDLEKALKTKRKLAKSCGYKIKYSEFEMLGIIYEELGKLNKSESLYKEGLHNVLNDSIGLIKLDIIEGSSSITGYDSNYNGIIKMYNHLGDIYMKQKRYQKAHESYSTAYKLCIEHSKLKSTLFKCTVNLANCFFYKENYEFAILFYQEALEVVKDIKIHIDPSLKDIEYVKKQIAHCHQKSNGAE